MLASLFLSLHPLSRRPLHQRLKNKNLPKKFFNQVYKKLYRMQKSNLEKNREKMRIGNLTSQQIDRNREKAREVNMTPENIRRKREKDLLRIRAMRSKAKQSKA